MKTRLHLLFLLTVIGFLPIKAQYIFTDQMNIIPLAKGAGEVKLDSILIQNEGDDIHYSLIPQYNSAGEIAEYVTGNVVIEGEQQLNTFMNIEVSALSATQKELVMTIVVDGLINHRDSTVINYNENGYEVSAVKYNMEDGKMVYDSDIQWYYPDMISFYSVKNGSDTVYYTNNGTKLNSALQFKDGVFERADFSYDESGNLIKTAHSYTDTAGIHDGMSITFHWQPLITSVAKTNLDVNIFPNPTSSVMTVNSQHNCTVQIFTVNGRPVKRLNANCNEMINLAGLAKGYYIVRITDAFGGNQTRKVLLN